MAAEEDRLRLSRALADVAAGDREALRLLYDKTSAKLYGVCLRILGDRAEAEDVLQETYLAVWNRAGAYDPDRGLSPITWLATIARNKAIDRARSRARAPEPRPLEAALEVPDGGPSAESLAAAAGERARLEACLGQLDARQAEAVRRAFYEGVTYEALAERMSVPLGTLKSWIRRSLMRLRLCLDAA